MYIINDTKRYQNKLYPSLFLFLTLQSMILEKKPSILILRSFHLPDDTVIEMKKNKFTKVKDKVAKTNTHLSRN